MKSTLSTLENICIINLKNNRGHSISVDFDKYDKVYKIIIYDSSEKLNDVYYNLIGIDSSEIGFIHLFNIKDYEKVCIYLHTPIEIQEYLDFRELFHNDFNTINELRLLGYYISGNDIYDESFDYERVLKGFDKDKIKFDMNFIISIFYDRILNEYKSEEYYKILEVLSCLNRNELKAFKERFSLSIEKASEKEINLPYRIAIPRLDCGFVFIPCPYDENIDLLIPLNNFTLAHKYDQKLRRCIGVIIMKERNSSYLQVFWSFIDNEWKYDDLLEKELKRNFPFREVKEAVIPKY